MLGILFCYKKRAELSVTEKFNFTILVAPLDWGLGHATRCTPIITHLLEMGCKVIIAAEGAQEKLLKTDSRTCNLSILQVTGSATLPVNVFFL